MVFVSETEEKSGTAHENSDFTPISELLFQIVLALPIRLHNYESRNGSIQYQ
mgnify:CR=1 FL=1|jgi:hypothetical protein